MGGHIPQFSKTEKFSEDGENAKLRYGLSSMQGWFATIEDARKQQLRKELNIPSNIEDFDVGFFERLKLGRTRNYIVELEMDKRKVIHDDALKMARRVMDEVCGSGRPRNILYLVGSTLCCKLRDHDLRRMKAGIASYADNRLAAETKGKLILDEFNTPRTVRPLAGTTSYDDYRRAALAERKQQLRKELNIPSNIEDFDVGFFEHLKLERTRNYIVELNMDKREVISDDAMKMDKRKVIHDDAVKMARRVMDEVCGSGRPRNILYLVGNTLCCKLRDHELRRLKGREDVLSVTLDRPDCKVA